MTDAIVQARMSSTRLPGKILHNLEGQSVLSHVVERIGRAQNVDRVILVLPESLSDDPLYEHAVKLTDHIYRGNELDVLDRYYQAAKHFEVEHFFRITSDCPMIDPGILDRMVEHFSSASVDYMSNMLEPGLPRGLDAELLSFEILEKAWKNAKKEHEREHVTPYIYQNPELFKIKAHIEPVNLAEWRWTLDTPEDLELIRAVFAGVYKSNPNFLHKDIIEFINKFPEIAQINAQVVQKKF